jgi:anti-sigma-K factor RskA
MTERPDYLSPTQPLSPSDLIAAYALGALSVEARTLVEELLEESAGARNELHEIQEMLEAMATTVPPRRAPADLTAKFRAQLAQAESSSSAATLVTPAVSRPVQPPAANVVQMPARRMSQSQRLATMVAAVSITFAVMILMAMGAMAVNRMNTERAVHEEMDRIMHNGDTHKVQLNPMDGAEGKVMLYMLPDSPKAVLVAELPSLPDEQAYQLWLMKPDSPKSAMVFKAGQHVEMLISMPEPLANYMATGITVEPSTGSPAPTTNPIFLAKFAE